MALSSASTAQARLEVVGERPADDFPGEGVHDHRQIDELLRQTDVGDIYCSAPTANRA